MKIMIATFGQETNTFSPDRIGIEKFLSNGWIKAERLVEDFRGTKSYLGGAIAACEMPGLRSTNLEEYPYKKIRRPIYPLDDDMVYPGQGGKQEVKVCL